MKSIPLAALLVLAFAFPAGGALAQSPAAAARQGGPPADVSAAAHHDVSPPLRSITPAPRLPGQSPAHPPKPLPRPGGNSQTAGVQTGNLRGLMPTTLNNFLGIGTGFSGPQGSFSVQSAPPDPNASVGPNHIVETVNTDFAVFNKSGTVLYGPVPINTLWSGFGGGCQTNNDGDPAVKYDPIADRWVITQFSVNTTPYLQCVAVSQTPDPTGAYYRYSFSYGNTDFPDYPKISVWPDAYYETFNIFANGSTFSGARVCAYDRTRMLTGAAATQQCFNTSTTYGGLLASDLDGSTLPPAGSPNYVVGLGATSTTLAYWKFHVDWTTPGNSTFTGPTALTVASYSEACGGGTCIPQGGTSQQLDSLADRLMYRLAYRNFGDHEALVVDHSVTAGSSTGMRWYELRPDASHNLSVFQQGTYAPDSNYRWMGSIAQDQQGNMAMGYSVSSSSVKPQIRYTGRLVSDPAGTMGQGESTIIAGGGSQTGQSLSRWGDYTSMAVDPSDGCTFWYTNEYIPSNGAFNWSTRIGSFKFPGCGGTVTNDFSISANPSSLSLTSGASGSSTINTAVTSGSAQSVSLAVSGVPSGATASLSPASVTAGSSSTLTVNTGTAAAGTYTLTVTGTGTSATHSTTVSLTVNPVVTNDFSISASPSSVSIVQGSSGTSTISTAVTSGSAQTVALSVSGLPSGASASFNPTSVTAGASSTLTINTGTAAAGTYSLTVTGTGTSATHTTSISLTVTAPVTNDFSISASPSSLSITSGSSGTSTISTAVTSGSAQSVTLSVSGIPSGASTGFSTNPITSGNSSTLTVNTGTAAAGTYTLTVTGTGTSATHSTTLSLTITSSSGGGVTNGGFETGTFAGWTTAGAATSIASGGAHSGTYAARAGSTSPTNGDSSIAQTFTAPSGTGTISFYYKVVCPDTVTYDWATATLKDNTANTTSTLLGKTCTNSGAWVQVTGTITAGHSYTLTLISHDDNYTGDPTYTLYDDVTLGASSPPPPTGITNGGFETGSFSGWTTSGAATAIVSSGAHSGTYAARAGSTSPTNGDSNIAQSFTAGTGSSQLVFWYKNTCPDTLTYDWATATLKDNTSNTTTTVLAKTCVAAGAWTQVTAAVTAGHSYTLTLTSHDDNYAGDPTYTLFDDVALQ